MARKKPQNPVKAALAAMEDPTLRRLFRHSIDHTTDGRFNLLNDHDGYYTGNVYDKRPYDWSGKATEPAHLVLGARAMTFWDMQQKPVSQRRPNSKYLLGRIIVNRFATMLFGQKRFPRIAYTKSKTNEFYLNAIVKQAQMPMKMIHAAILGGRTGSVVTLFSVVEGKFRLENFNTKWVTPIWSDFQEGEMAGFSVVYPFTKYIFDETRRTFVQEVFIYRRVVTNTLDVEFEPQPAKISIQGNGVKITPKEPDQIPIPNEDRTFAHNLGFVPAQFIQHMMVPDDEDGEPACEGAFELIDRINENLSAVNAALQGNLDPTLVLKITPDDYRKLQTMGGIVQTGADGACLVVGDKGDAKFIEITCEGIKAAMTIINEMRTWVLETCDCVIADPHKLTGAAQSAAAIRLLYAPMLSKADLLRVQYGDNGISKLLAKMVKAYLILSDVQENEDGELVKGKFKPIEIKDPASDAMITVVPEGEIDPDDIDLVWGSYFEATTADQFQAVEAAVMATGGKPVTTPEAAAIMVAPYMNDLNVERTIVEMEGLQQEADTREEKMAVLGKKQSPAPTMTPKPSRPSDNG